MRNCGAKVSRILLSSLVSVRMRCVRVAQTSRITHLKLHNAKRLRLQDSSSAQLTDLQ